MKITVLGGGHGCYAAALEMAEKGHDVVLWCRDAEALNALAATSQLFVKDFQGERSGTVGFENSQINLQNNLEKAIANFG